MKCHGGFHLDELTRRSWYNPEAILKDTGLASGMTFIDVGCGEGFFSLLAAQMVKKNGVVYCLDIDAEALERIKVTASEKGLANIRVVTAAGEENPPCIACADVVFCSMALHDFKDPVQVLVNAKKMLKPNGKIVDLDWKKQPMDFGPPEKIRFSIEYASKLMKMAGFNVDSVKEAGPYHYIITARY
jgi:ubiquinone/menaquinone biosynthesis C-methylase UbiE